MRSCCASVCAVLTIGVLSPLVGPGEYRVGCASPEPRANTRLAEPPAVGVSSASPVPVVYEKNLDVPHLDVKRVDEIVGRAAFLCPKGCRVWFIRVDGLTARGSNNLTVYFTPEKATPRFRKGSFVRIWSQRSAPKQVQTYGQVSLAGKPFSDALVLPEGNLRPFALAAGITDDEVVRVVEFARTSPRSPRDDAFRGEEPLLEISKANDVTVVRSGTQRGPLAGSGQSLELRKKNETYEVVRVGAWRS
jgi:hypothetical protein